MGRACGSLRGLRDPVQHPRLPRLRKPVPRLWRGLQPRLSHPPASLFRPGIGERTDTMAALEGQCVLIRGGRLGLGLAIVERFSEEGARMTVLDRSAERLAALASRFAGSVEAVVGDVRSTADNQRAVEAGVARFGRLDCAIGNAGIWDYSRPLDAIALESIDSAFDEVFHINVKGYLHLAKASLPALVRSC